MSTQENMTITKKLSNLNIDDVISTHSHEETDSNSSVVSLFDTTDEEQEPIEETDDEPSVHTDEEDEEEDQINSEMDEPEMLSDESDTEESDIDNIETETESDELEVQAPIFNPEDVSDSSDSDEDINKMDITTDKPCNIRKRKKNTERKALKEIAHYQQTTGFLIPVAPFKRLVREILNDISLEDFQITNDAFEALQTASEDYLIDLLRKSQYAAIHSGRQEVYPKDMQFVRIIMNEIYQCGVNC